MLRCARWAGCSGACSRYSTCRIHAAAHMVLPAPHSHTCARCGLQQLDLSGCTGIGNDAIQCFSRLYTLHALCLAGCRQLTHEALSWLRAYELRWLSLAGCVQATDAVVVQLLDRCPGLEVKGSSELTRIQPNTRSPLTATTPLHVGAQVLDVAGCHRLTDAVLEALSAVEEHALADAACHADLYRALRRSGPQLALAPKLHTLHTAGCPELSCGALRAAAHARFHIGSAALINGRRLQGDSMGKLDAVAKVAHSSGSAQPLMLFGGPWGDDFDLGASDPSISGPIHDYWHEQPPAHWFSWARDDPAGNQQGTHQRRRDMAYSDGPSGFSSAVTQACPQAAAHVASLPKFAGLRKLPAAAAAARREALARQVRHEHVAATLLTAVRRGVVVRRHYLVWRDDYRERQRIGATMFQAAWRAFAPRRNFRRMVVALKLLHDFIPRALAARRARIHWSTACRHYARTLKRKSLTALTDHTVAAQEARGATSSLAQLRLCAPWWRFLAAARTTVPQ